MVDDAKLYRERAAAERGVAADTMLPNVRERALRSAYCWDELAIRADRAKAGADARQR